jgi:hypothetical protein
MIINIPDLILSRMKREDAILFCDWAWGYDFKKIFDSSTLLRVWNERHGDKLKLLGSNRPSNDIDKMIVLWKESLEDAK